MTTALVLTIVEGTQGFVVYRETYRVGFGCVLMQYEKVIDYSSLIGNEKNYPIHD